jgi:hypothetical protein
MGRRPDDAPGAEGWYEAPSGKLLRAVGSDIGKAETFCRGSSNWKSEKDNIDSLPACSSLHTLFPGICRLEGLIGCHNASRKSWSPESLSNKPVPEEMA